MSDLLILGNVDNADFTVGWRWIGGYDPGTYNDPGYDYEWTGPGNDTDSGADEGSAPEGSGDYGTVDENYEDD